MPTYEYACAACQHEFEAFQSIKDAPLTACPKCGADEARRQISRGTGFILKGGGWYSDLYASPSGNKKPSEGGGSVMVSSSSSALGGSGAGGSSDPHAAVAKIRAMPASGTMARERIVDFTHYLRYVSVIWLG